jgi:hypothetical protein
VDATRPAGACGDGSGVGYSLIVKPCSSP